MNAFLESLVSRIAAIGTRDDLALLYDWIWDNHNEVAATASQINAELGLNGPRTLQPDLPCLSVGSTSGLVVLAANPGWKSELNKMEDDYCRRSKEAYVDMMFNFFQVHPRERGNVYSRWWSRAMRFITLLPGERQSLPKNIPKRWEQVHKTALLGGWELFPWHSTKDGVTSKLRKHPWLKEFCHASIGAILRLNPQLLFVASSAGHQLVRHDLGLEGDWQDFELSGTKGAYARTETQREILTIKLQLFSGAFRRFTDEELFSKVRELRATTLGK